MNWYVKVWKQYTDFKGRARRKEFWMFTLVHFIILIFFGFLISYYETGFHSDEDVSMIVLGTFVLYILATIIPYLAVTVRRLHDIGKSGMWCLLCLIPYIGNFWLLILTCMDSKNGSNKWGENPKGIGNDSLIAQIGTE